MKQTNKKINVLKFHLLMFFFFMLYVNDEISQKLNGSIVKA